MNQAEFEALVERIVKTCGGGTKRMISGLPRYEDLSGEADTQIYQGNTPGYNWTWNSLSQLTTWNSLVSSFRPGAQKPEAGKSYLALFGRGSAVNGISASVFTVGSDGSSITWDEEKRWDLPLGSEVAMPNGSIYKVIKAPNAGSFPIYEAVKPIVGKIPLEVNGTATSTYFSGLSNVSVSFKAQGGSSAPYQGTVFVNGCSDCDYYVDCSGLETNDGGKTTLVVYLDADNAAIPAGSQYLGESNLNSDHPGIQEYRICNGSWGQDEKYVQTPPYADIPTVLMGTAVRFYQDFLVRDPSWVFTDGTKLRRDVRISLVGYAPMITCPLAYEGVE